MEKMEIKKVRCQAKVVGTIVTVGGAMLMTLYKGDLIKFAWSKAEQRGVQSNYSSTADNDKDWLKGSILLIMATFAWASFFILQAVTLKRYSAQLSLTALVCFIGTLQSIAVTFVMEHMTSTVWSIGWDINLLAAAYAGIVSSSLAYYVQGLVMQKRGPVFVTAFSPLMMIIVAVMGSFMLAENFYVGGYGSRLYLTFVYFFFFLIIYKSVFPLILVWLWYSAVGAALIVAGLYLVLWGKYKEYQEKEAELDIIIPQALNGGDHNISTIINVGVETEAADNTSHHQFQNTSTPQANKLSTVQLPHV